VKTAEQRRETLKLPAQLGDEFMHFHRSEALDGHQLGVWEGTDAAVRYEMVVGRCPGR